MNRLLMIPAVCSALAFAALVATLHGAPGREALSSQRLNSPPAFKTTHARGDLLLPVAEAEQVLQSLSDDYLRPWRQWEKSPHRLYSRAAPRPIPSISAEIELASHATGENERVLLATITIRKGTQVLAVPCVVDRITHRARLFAGGKWLAEEEWLKQAPLP